MQRRAGGVGGHRGRRPLGPRRPRGGARRSRALAGLPRREGERRRGCLVEPQRSYQLMELAIPTFRMVFRHVFERFFDMLSEIFRGSLVISIQYSFEFGYHSLRDMFQNAEAARCAEVHDDCTLRRSA